MLAQFAAALSPMSTASLRHFVSLFHRDHLARGAAFVQVGEISTKVAFLCRGTLRAFFVTEAGDEYTKDFFVPCSFVASPISLFSTVPSGIEIRAAQDSELLVADYTEIERLYDHSPDASRFGRKVLERAYVEREQKEYELAVFDATVRYRLFLDRFPGLGRHISQAHVASYLGITPTHLSRIRGRRSEER